VAFSSSAPAKELAELEALPPDHVIVSNKPLFEIERCIVVRDWSIPAIVYRTPDRPDESLIYFAKFTFNPKLISLKREGNRTIISFRNFGPDDIQNCI
jgi:hypothetical protein